MQSEGSEQIVIETYVIDTPSLFLAFTGDTDDCDRRPPRCGSECRRSFMTLDSHRANLDRMSRMLQKQS